MKKTFITFFLLIMFCIDIHASEADNEKPSAGSVIMGMPSLAGHIILVTPIAVCPVANTLSLFVTGDGTAESADSKYDYYIDKKILKKNKNKIKEFVSNPIFRTFWTPPEVNVKTVSKYRLNDAENIDYKIKIADKLSQKLKNQDYKYDTMLEHILGAVDKNNYEFFDLLISDEEYNAKDLEEIEREADFYYNPKNISLIGVSGLKNGTYKKYRLLINTKKGSFNERYKAYLLLCANGFSDDHIRNIMNNDGYYAVKFINKYGVYGLKDGSYEKFRNLWGKKTDSPILFAEAYNVYSAMKSIGYSDKQIQDLLNNNYALSHIMFVDINELKKPIYIDYLNSVKWKKNWYRNEKDFKNRYVVYKSLRENNFTKEEIKQYVNSDNLVMHYNVVGSEDLKNGNYNKFLSLNKYPCYSDETYKLFKMLNEHNFSDDEIKSLINKNGTYDEYTIQSLLDNKSLTNSQKIAKIKKKIKNVKEEKNEKREENLVGLRLYTAGMGCSYKYAYNDWYETVKFRERVRKEKRLKKH